MSDLVNSIKNRIKANNGSFHANDNISEYLMAGELESLQKELEKNIQDVLDTLIIDEVSMLNDELFYKISEFIF